MTNIVAGRFELQADAESATIELLHEGFKRNQVSSFFVNTPGQHGRLPIGGDRNVSPGARGAAAGAIAGAAIGGGFGLLAGLLAEPWIGAIGTAAVTAGGVYLGSLGGALVNLQDKMIESPAGIGPEPEVRHAGVMLAAHAPTPKLLALGLAILQASGARDIETVDGIWRDGRWADFDPVKPPRREDERSTESAH